MKRWLNRALTHGTILAPGAVAFGVLQAVGMINYNQIWFQFLITLLNLIVTVLFGGSLDSLTGNFGITV